MTQVYNYRTLLQIYSISILTHPCLQVKELVSSELFERYDRLLLQLSLDTMNDIMYCPRKACASPVVVDKDSAMGSCAACGYVFCVYCQMVWHGVSVCKMKAGVLITFCL